MNKILILLIIFMNSACTTNKGSYWCGDHPCINKKEKEAYFKKTMIVEIKEKKSINEKNKTQIQKISEQAHINEKKRIKEEKNYLKQKKNEIKNKIKEEKRLKKQAKKNT